MLSNVCGVTSCERCSWMVSNAFGRNIRCIVHAHSRRAVAMEGRAGGAMVRDPTHGNGCAFRLDLPPYHLFGPILTKQKREMFRFDRRISSLFSEFSGHGRPVY